MPDDIEQALHRLQELANRFPADAAPRFEPPATTEDIASFEAAAGSSLPRALKAFLLMTRGVVAMGIRNGYWIGGVSELTRSLRRGDFPSIVDAEGRSTRMINRAVHDWSEWSREAVRLMQERNAAWQDRLALRGCPFHWDLESATIAFQRDDDDVVAALCVVGTTSAAEGTFLWAWANESIPAAARRGLDVVRDFGLMHELDLLTTAEFRGGRAEALEMLAIAGRIMDAEGVFIADSGDVSLFFALSEFRILPTTM